MNLWQISRSLSLINKNIVRVVLFSIVKVVVDYIAVRQVRVAVFLLKIVRTKICNTSEKEEQYKVRVYDFKLCSRCGCDARFIVVYSNAMKFK